MKENETCFLSTFIEVNLLKHKASDAGRGRRGSLSISIGGRQFVQTEVKLRKQLAVRYQNQNPAVHVQEFLGLGVKTSPDWEDQHQGATMSGPAQPKIDCDKLVRDILSWLQADCQPQWCSKQGWHPQDENLMLIVIFVRRELKQRDKKVRK